MFRSIGAALLCLGACHAVQQQQLVLISNGAGNETERVSITGYINNLDVLGFNEKTSTACAVSGVWLLFSNSDFNTNSFTGNAVHYIYGDNVCSGSTYLEGQISSVRYAGSVSNWKANALNLYGKTWYQGREQFLVSDGYTILLDNVNSVIVTGTQPWILFDSENFVGNGVCVTPYEPAYNQPGMYPRLEATVKSAKLATEEECLQYRSA